MKLLKTSDFHLLQIIKELFYLQLNIFFHKNKNKVINFHLLKLSAKQKYKFNTNFHENFGSFEEILGLDKNIGTFGLKLELCK